MRSQYSARSPEGDCEKIAIIRPFGAEEEMHMTSFNLIKTSCLLGAAVVAGLGLGRPASAAVENFDGYATGPLAGQANVSATGGIAWTGAWGELTVGGAGSVADGSIGTASGVASATPFATKTLDGTTGAYEAMRGFTPVAGDGTLYVSGLVSVDYDANFPTQSYGGFGLYEGTQERFLLGQLYESAVYGAATPNAFASATSNVAIGDAQVVYLVTKLDQQANTVSLWVSPDLSQMEGDVPADVVFAYGASEDTVDTLRLRGGLASTGNTWSYDNLSVSTQTPFGVIPEPTTAALLGVGGMFALGRRRRHG